jgi:hypothetical protein
VSLLDYLQVEQLKEFSFEEGYPYRNDTVLRAEYLEKRTESQHILEKFIALPHRAVIFIRLDNSPFSYWLLDEFQTVSGESYQ